MRTKLALLVVAAMGVAVFATAGTCDDIDVWNLRGPAPASTPYDVGSITHPVPPGFGSWQEYITWVKDNILGDDGEVYTGGDVQTVGAPEDLALADSLGVDLTHITELFDITATADEIVMKVQAEQLFLPDGSPGGWLYSGCPAQEGDFSSGSFGGDDTGVGVVTCDISEVTPTPEVLP